MSVSPHTPNSIMEFQGGAFDPWGGPGYEACAILLNHEFERVFYKNKISFSTTIFNLYMVSFLGFAYQSSYCFYKFNGGLIQMVTDFRRH